MLSLNELLIFVTAAETGNFTEAGRQLSLSQPAISQTMDSLEKRFGTKLFMRQGRSVRLTEAGQVLKPIARELLSTARRLDETMSSLNGEVVGEMTLGCSTASGKYLLPRLIAYFRRKFAQVRINVLVTSRELVLNKVLAGEFSLGVSSKMIEHHDLEYQEFFKDEVILIVPSDHRWTRFRTIFPDDLLEEPVILREEGAGSREVLMQGLSQHDITPDMLNVVMVLGNAEAIVMAVEEGLGVAFVSRLAANRGLECGHVVEIKVQGLPLKRSIFLVRNRRFPATHSQSEFWSFVKASELDLKALCTPLPLP
jgi:DNA-binding transcriptional LysR family regulator